MIQHYNQSSVLYLEKFFLNLILSWNPQLMALKTNKKKGRYLFIGVERICFNLLLKEKRFYCIIVTQFTVFYFTAFAIFAFYLIGRSCSVFKSYIYFFLFLSFLCIFRILMIILIHIQNFNEFHKVLSNLKCND